MSAPDGAWLNAAQLAQEWGVTERWVADKMAAGAIPSVKIGARRWFTPACRAALEAAQVKPAKASNGWARPPRSK